MRSLLIYVGAVLLGGALLAPWLYWLAQWAAEQSPAFTNLAGQPFHRYVNRSVLGLALAGLWPFLRGLGANSWAAVGLVHPAGHGGRLAAGFALGFGSLAVVAVLAVGLGARKFSAPESASVWVTLLGKASLTAAVVSVLEEVLFRGALFGALRQAHGWMKALLTSSAVYALVHFFQKPPPPTDITWLTGLAVLPRMMRGFVEVEMLVPGFFTLTLAGAILALAYQRTGNLYTSIGLHAGWIFWLKFYGAVTVAQPGANVWFWGTAKMIDGWLALLVLASVLGFMAFVFRGIKKVPHVR